MVNRQSTLVTEVYYITQYKFRNENLLLEVFTPPYLHSKNITTPYCYERLEFLGDSVLNLVVSILLFELYPLEQEGDLTLRKNDLVSGRRLVEIGRSLKFMQLMPECPGKVLRRESDALEALIGAIFIDGGFENAKQFIVRNWKKPARQMHIAPMDAKSKLYIWAQRRHLPVPLYKAINKTQLEVNYTLTLQLRDTHGLGIVKVITDIKKRGEIDAAKAMMARIENREKWKTLFKSAGDYITEQDLISTSEDLKRRLYLWCKARNAPLPYYKTVEGGTPDNKPQFTTLVCLSNGRGAYGVSNNAAIAEKKAALKMLLRLCDEEREQVLFGGQNNPCEIDVCTPRNFKSLTDEWVTKNHLGEIIYTCQELVADKLFNVSLTIPKSDLGTVFSKSYNKKLAEHRAAALMIETIVTCYNSSENHLTDDHPPTDNSKIELHTWLHSRNLPKSKYKLEKVSGLRHSLLFTVSVSVIGQNKTVASAYSKRLAEQRAASLMVKQIQSSIQR